jgi:hypothetical protein
LLTYKDDGGLECSRHTEEGAHQLLPLSHPFARKAAGADVHQVAPKKVKQLKPTGYKQERENK